jgi:hypothetical protein
VFTILRAWVVVVVEAQVEVEKSTETCGAGAEEIGRIKWTHRPPHGLRPALSEFDDSWGFFCGPCPPSSTKVSSNVSSNVFAGFETRPYTNWIPSARS